MEAVSKARLPIDFVVLRYGDFPTLSALFELVRTIKKYVKNFLLASCLSFLPLELS